MTGTQEVGVSPKQCEVPHLCFHRHCLESSSVCVCGGEIKTRNDLVEHHHLMNCPLGLFPPLVVQSTPSCANLIFAFLPTLNWSHSLRYFRFTPGLELPRCIVTRRGWKRAFFDSEECICMLRPNGYLTTTCTRWHPACNTKYKM